MENLISRPASRGLGASTNGRRGRLTDALSGLPKGRAALWRWLLDAAQLRRLFLARLVRWPSLVALTWLSLGVAGLFWTSTAGALEVPTLQGRVNDLAGVLSAPQAKELEARLADYEQRTGHQFALLTVPTLDGEDIEGFSIRTVEKWGLGQKQKDDGVLLLVAVNDRKMRIEVGYGLEPNIPDILAGRIIRNVMAPHFRQGDYAAGINAAFDSLMKAAAGEQVAVPERKPKAVSWKGFVAPLFWLVLFLVIGLSRGGRRGGLLFLPPFGGSGGHRGGFGGFGGGGGFSGGGGGFGGGGASGNW